jgi:cytochrome c553
VRFAHELVSVGLSTRTITAAVVALVALLAASACTDGKESAPQVTLPATSIPSSAPAMPTAVAATPERSAKQIYAVRCTPCHGANGRGDGVISASLTPKPRDYTNAAWQASVTDDQLKKTILSGGEAVGKSQMMPANPDLAAKVDVTNALVQMIRSFSSTPK